MVVVFNKIIGANGCIAASPWLLEAIIIREFINFLNAPGDRLWEPEGYRRRAKSFCLGLSPKLARMELCDGRWSTFLSS